MIVNFKIFEEFNIDNEHDMKEKSKTPPNYKSGDTVIYIYKNGTNMVKYGEKYKVQKVFFHEVYYYVKLDSYFSYYSSKFTLEHEFYADKYNI